MGTRTASDDRMTLEQLGELCGTLSKMCPKDLTREQAQLLIGANGEIGDWLKVGLTHDIKKIPTRLVRALIEGRLDVGCERFSANTIKKLRRDGWKIIEVKGNETLTTMLNAGLCQLGPNEDWEARLRKIRNDRFSEPREVAWFPPRPWIHVTGTEYLCTKLSFLLNDRAMIPRSVFNEVMFIEPFVSEAVSIACQVGHLISGSIGTATGYWLFDRLGVKTPLEKNGSIVVETFSPLSQDAGFLKLLAPV